MRECLKSYICAERCTEETAVSVFKMEYIVCISGSKFQCIYCGKDFLSMPNMKKHVRFHLGYRATCRICSDAFSNVGALRKHTRVSHPDVYKAKLIARLEKFGVLKGPDKNALSKEIIEKVNREQKKLKEALENKDSVEIVKKETEKSESVFIEKEEEIDNEINFSADEIDDGGSRFKFACTVCKKRFSSYINMCRHRRKIHNNENRHKTEQCLTFGRKPRNNPSPVLENPLEVAAFYANISHNIATNLNCYIDGKTESLDTFVNHIKVDDYKGNFGFSVENEQPVDLIWEKYNFPRDYKPAQTISFADIKNVLDIHNDFESHCMSVDARSVQCSSGKNYVNGIRDLRESTDISGDCIGDIISGETIEDFEVRKINSVDETSAIHVNEQIGENNLVEKEVNHIEQSVNSLPDTMGKSSHGLKILPNVGSVLSKKGPTVKCETNRTEGRGFYRFRIAGGVLMNADSPAAKTFHQVYYIIFTF